MSNDVQEVVTDIVVQMLKTRGITVTPTEDLSLIDSGMLDSISIVTFVAHLEKEFDIAFSMSDMIVDNFDNVKVISDLVRSKRA